MFKLSCTKVLLFIILISTVHILAQGIPTTIKEVYNVDKPNDMEESNLGKTNAAKWETKLPISYNVYYGASLTDGNEQITFGGDVGIATNLVTAYNINTDSYRSLQSMTIPLRVSAAFKLTGKYHVLGGFTNGNNNPVDTHLEFDVGTQNWTAGVSLTAGRFFHRALAYKDLGAFVIGGIGDSDPEPTVEFWNMSDGMFHSATDMPTGRADGGAAWLDENEGRMIYISGWAPGFDDSPVQVDTVYIGEVNPNDPTEITWSTGPNFPGGPRARINAYSWGHNQVIVVGGTDNPTFDPAYSDVWIYNHDAKEWASWTQLEDKPIPIMAYHGGSFSLPNDVWKLAIIGGITTGSAFSRANEVFTDTIKAPVSVENVDDVIPNEYNLAQNYPNPFNPSTTIQFSIPVEGFVSLNVFNSLGEKVSTLVSENLNVGTYKFDWNAADLPSGIYFYRLNANEYSVSKKMILLK